MITLSTYVMSVNLFAVTAVLACGIAGVSQAQVLAPAKIKDPKLRALQSKYLDDLTAATTEIASHSFPSKFYLTRVLDLRKSALDSADRGAVEFATFGKQTVLRVRGNYSAIYASEMSPKDRVSRTYLDVVVPILNATIRRVKNETEMDALFIELSHHVRKVTVMTIDRFENLAFILPRASAQKLAETSDPTQQLAGLMDATVYVDGRVMPFGGQAGVPAAVVATQNLQEPDAAAAAPRPSVSSPAKIAESVSPHNGEGPSTADLDRMVQELGPQANFDPLAKPALIAFRGVSYWRLSMKTTLAAADAGSQYRLAALAFDRHVSHLIRPVLPYFKDAQRFGGIAFRTTVNAGSNDPPESVEFIFPIADLRRYESYEITGQQLINAGFVLINGERVGLDLQSAEAVKP